MFFVFPVPLWFVLLYLAGHAAFAIWDWLEGDCEPSSEEKWAYKMKVEAGWAGLPVDTYILLKKAAESRWT